MNILVDFYQICLENGQICSHHGFHGLLGNANQCIGPMERGYVGRPIVPISERTNINGK